MGGFGQLPPRRRVLVDGEWETIALPSIQPIPTGTSEITPNMIRMLEESRRDYEGKRSEEKKDSLNRTVASLKVDVGMGEEETESSYDDYGAHTDSMSEYDRRPTERLEERFGRMPAPLGLQRAAAEARDLRKDDERLESDIKAVEAMRARSISFEKVRQLFNLTPSLIQSGTVIKPPIAQQHSPSNNSHGSNNACTSEFAKLDELSANWRQTWGVELKMLGITDDQIRSHQHYIAEYIREQNATPEHRKFDLIRVRGDPKAAEKNMATSERREVLLRRDDYEENGDPETAKNPYSDFFVQDECLPQPLRLKKLDGEHATEAVETTPREKERKVESTDEDEAYNGDDESEESRNDMGQKAIWLG